MIKDELPYSRVNDTMQVSYHSTLLGFVMITVVLYEVGLQILMMDDAYVLISILFNNDSSILY